MCVVYILPPPRVYHHCNIFSHAFYYYIQSIAVQVANFLRYWSLNRVK